MAYDIEASFGPNSRTTTTNAPGLSVNPASTPTLPTLDLSFMQDELRRRMLAERGLVDLQREALRKRLLQGDNAGRLTPGSAPMMSGNFDPNAAQRQATEAEQLRAAMMQAQAMTQQAPTRMVTGPGIIPGYTMDTNAMTGAQRSVFLPQNSTNDPMRDAAAEGARRTNEAASFDNFRRESDDRQRRQNAYYGR